MQSNVTFSDPQDARDLLEGRLARLKKRQNELASGIRQNTYAVTATELQNPDPDRAERTARLFARWLERAQDDLGALLVVLDDIRIARRELAALDAPQATEEDQR